MVGLNKTTRQLQYTTLSILTKYSKTKIQTRFQPDYCPLHSLTIICADGGIY